MNAKGSVFKYPDNVDTDVIIPARYLNTQSPGAGQPLHGGHRQGLRHPNVKDGDIMVGGWNFGCGSSREHAPLCHQDRRHSLRHCQELCPYLLPQQHQHRPAHHGVPEAVDAINAGRYRERGL